MNKFALKIISPQGIIFEGDVDMVVVPGSEGELGILARHIPLLSYLKPGEIRARQGTGEKKWDIKEGFIQVSEKGVDILARRKD